MNDTIQYVKTTSENKDFVALVAELDRSLWQSYPELTVDYWGNNILELNPNVVVVYIDEVAVACACFKKYDKNTVEIKRMFVSTEHRGKGLALKMLQELELWAHELGFSGAKLETLHKQEVAISMYKKAGYSIIDNYEPYVAIKQSICMSKRF